MSRQVRYTVVQHGPRLELGLSLTAYCIADAIHRLSSDPEHPVCTVTTGSLGEGLGLSKRSVIKNIGDLIDSGLVEKVTNGRLHVGYRSTKKWFESVEVRAGEGADERGEQSSPVKKVHRVKGGEESSPVKKVHGGCGEESSPGAVKKVHRGGEESSPPNIRETVRDSNRDSKERQLSLCPDQERDSAQDAVERLDLPAEDRLALRGLLSAPALVDVSKNRTAKKTDDRGLKIERLHLLAHLETSAANAVRERARRGDGADSALELYVAWRAARRKKHPKAPNTPWVEVSALRELLDGAHSAGEILDGLDAAYRGGWQGFEWQWRPGRDQPARQAAAGKPLAAGFAIRKGPKVARIASYEDHEEPADGAEIWASIRDMCKATMPPEEFGTWIAPAKLGSIASGVVHVVLPNMQFVLMHQVHGWLEKAVESLALPLAVRFEGAES